MIEAEKQVGAALAPAAPDNPTTETRRMGVIIGLMLTLFLAALDQTVVGTAMPGVIRELHGFERYAWVTTAYLLTTTLSLPIIARLSDLYGRKWLFLGGTTFFVVTSWFCGAAGNIPFLPWDGMTQLIIFRGLQGIGAGAITGLTFTVIGDLFTPIERGKYQGLFTGVFGIASIVGPGLGGYLTDHLSWRWVFYVNAPVGILAVAVLYITLPANRPGGKRHAIDWLGTATMAACLAPLLLALSTVTQSGWTSPRTLGLLGVSVVMLVAFLWAETRATEPLLPLSLFRDRVIAIASIAGFLLGVGMFGVLVYVPLFLQGVMGASATASGYLFTPLMLGAIIGSILGGQLVSRTGRYKTLSIIGAGLMVAGMIMFAVMNRDTSNLFLISCMIVFGLGLGLAQPVYTVVVQNAAPPQLMGIATAAVQFFRSIGSTVGVALFGTILFSYYHHGLNQAALDGNPDSLSRLVDNPLQLLQIVSQMASPPAGTLRLLAEIKNALEVAFTNLFWIGTAMTTIALIFNLFLPERPLRKHRT